MIAPLKKIIVCLDHTKMDRELIENACIIGKTAGATQITFLNVIKDFNLPDTVLKEFPDLMDKALKERRTEIKKLIDKYFKCEVPTKILVKQGGETKEILKAANDLKSDLIVLGRKKVSDSVLSTRIARRSPCNLLLIPEGKKLKFDKIFIPVDFSDYSSLSLKRTLLLTKDLKSKIYLQNVYQVPSSYRYSGKSYEEFAEVMKGHASKDLDFLIKKTVKKDQELIPVCTLDSNGKVIDLVLEEASRKKVDLIVMGAKGRTVTSALFIGSKAERMIRINENLPLMIIRKKGAVAGILETLKDL
ncbi:MAG: universal stress protein [Ekhidna sp.]|uniref:universal stress protein n=1 Tax=Ekhidna sp. TaxID=2608089 RepID=UPI0032EB1D6B